MPPRFSVSPEETRALATFGRLMRTARVVSQRVHRHLGEDGLSETQFAVLEVVAGFGPICQRDIGERISKSRANITMVVDVLEKKGLVKRERSSEDRRYYVVSLTVEGRRLVNDLFPRHARILEREMHLLSVEELEELDRLCRKLGEQRNSV